MKHALILHAWYNHPNDHWYPWLKTELENKGYNVDIPNLPTTDTDLPDLSKQFRVADKFIHDDSVVIGHSLGALLGMRLAEKYPLKQLILIAGWDYNDLYPQHRLYWPNPMNHIAIKKNVKNIIVISSDNDPYTTAFEAEEMSKRLNAKFILIKGAGHFTKQFGINEFPALLSLT